jgi:hypothetical protein
MRQNSSLKGIDQLYNEMDLTVMAMKTERERVLETINR